MEAYTKALRALSDTLSWFVRARELRLLYIETTPALRSAVIQLCRSKELHPDNPSPFVLLEDAHTREYEGWNEGVLRLRAQYAQRALAMEKVGEHLPPLPPAPSPNDGLRALAMQLEQFLFARAPWHDGMIALMAPVRVEQPQAYIQQLASLLSMNELLPLRFIVIDPKPPALSGVLAHGGESVLRATCAEDEKEAKAQLGAMIEAMAEAHPALSGPARIGAAWPSKGVLPPSRADWPHADPESIDAQLLEEGVVEPLAGTVGRKLSQAVLMGAKAMREQRLKEAVEHQRLALRLCVEAKEERGAVMMELVLGAYCAAENDMNNAQSSYESAGRRALGAGLFGLAAQAAMARAALYLRADRREEALSLYRGAAVDAGLAKAFLPALEAMRWVVSLESERANDSAAIHQALAAMALADTLSPEEAKASSAAEIARMLSHLYSKAKDGERADLWMAKSRIFEDPEVAQGEAEAPGKGQV